MLTDTPLQIITRPTEAELQEDAHDLYYYLLLAYFDQIDPTGRFCHWDELVRRIEDGRLIPAEIAGPVDWSAVGV